MNRLDQWLYIIVVWLKMNTLSLNCSFIICTEALHFVIECLEKTFSQLFLSYLSLQTSINESETLKSHRKTLKINKTFS